MESSDQPSDLEEKVAEHYEELEDKVDAWFAAMWKRLPYWWTRLRPYLLPGVFLLIAGVLGYDVLFGTWGSGGAMIAVSLIASTLILSATLLLIAHWYFPRR